MDEMSPSDLMHTETEGGALVTLGDMPGGAWLQVLHRRERHNDALSATLTTAEARQLGEWLINYADGHPDG